MNKLLNLIRSQTESQPSRSGTYVETYDRTSVRNVYEVATSAKFKSAEDKAREILKGVDKDSDAMQAYILKRVGITR